MQHADSHWYEIKLANEAETERFGALLARLLPRGALLYLHGDLGAGKTTLARGLLHALGYPGAVKSPTYALIEPYEINGRKVFHLDLYRLADPEELEAIGFRDCLGGDALCLIEWPERGSKILPPADLSLYLEPAGSGRRLRLSSGTTSGQHVLDRLNVM